MAAVAATGAAWIEGACAMGLRGPAGTAAFRVECNVPDAGIWVDDALIGRVSEWSQPGHYIRPGVHRVEIRHPEYYSHFAEVEATEKGEAVVRADLRPLLE
jgi:hypothetical protein